MAVFTPVTPEQLTLFLKDYALGEVHEIQGISSGIENSNFFITLKLDGRLTRYVLTLFERLSHEQLPFYLGMMHHLAKKGVACPDTLADREGEALKTLNAKPAAIFTCLKGSAKMQPSAAHCQAVGQLLAQMHLACVDYPGRLANLRGLSWWNETAPKVSPFLSRSQADLLQTELSLQNQFAQGPVVQALPKAAVHADLFKDNVLFDDQGDHVRLGGAIDFYFAGVDHLIFDLAVTANDWCIDEASGEFLTEHLNAFLQAYCAVRMPSAAEQQAWPLMLRAAALRFWMSRLFDYHLPRPAEMVTPKDPNHFERILRLRRIHPSLLVAAAR
jgi:homoserine kinase type II